MFGLKVMVILIQEFQKVLEQKEDGRLSVTFYPGINEYMGRRSLQIVITHCQ